MSLANLNSSGIQQDNPALYQAIKDLYDQNLRLTNLVNSYKFIVDVNGRLNGDFGGLLGVSGGQIKFPALQNPSIDANTLDDYKKGVTTPSDGSGAGLVFAVSGLTYVKIGGLVVIQGQIVYPATVNGLANTINGLPYRCNGGNGAVSIGYYGAGPEPSRIWVQAGTSQLRIMNGGATYTNAQLSGTNIVFGGVYIV